MPPNAQSIANGISLLLSQFKSQGEGGPAAEQSEPYVNPITKEVSHIFGSEDERKATKAGLFQEAITSPAGIKVIDLISKAAKEGRDPREMARALGVEAFADNIMAFTGPRVAAELEQQDKAVETRQRVQGAATDLGLQSISAAQALQRALGIEQAPAVAGLANQAQAAASVPQLSEAQIRTQNPTTLQAQSMQDEDNALRATQKLALRQQGVMVEMTGDDYISLAERDPGVIATVARMMDQDARNATVTGQPVTVGFPQEKMQKLTTQHFEALASFQSRIAKKEFAADSTQAVDQAGRLNEQRLGLLALGLSGDSVPLALFQLMADAATKAGQPAFFDAEALNSNNPLFQQALAQLKERIPDADMSDAQIDLLVNDLRARFEGLDRDLIGLDPDTGWIFSDSRGQVSLAAMRAAGKTAVATEARVPLPGTGGWTAMLTRNGRVGFSFSKQTAGIPNQGPPGLVPGAGQFGSGDATAPRPQPQNVVPPAAPVGSDSIFATAGAFSEANRVLGASVRATRLRSRGEDGRLVSTPRSKQENTRRVADALAKLDVVTAAESGHVPSANLVGAHEKLKRVAGTLPELGALVAPEQSLASTVLDQTGAGAAAQSLQSRVESLPLVGQVVKALGAGGLNRFAESLGISEADAKKPNVRGALREFSRALRTVRRQTAALQRTTAGLRPPASDFGSAADRAIEAAPGAAAAGRSVIREVGRPLNIGRSRARIRPLDQ